MECRPFPSLARTWPMPAGARTDRACPRFVRRCATTQSAMPRSFSPVNQTLSSRLLAPLAGLVSRHLQPMSTDNLDRLLSAASDFDASDLHLVAGVPPAFRVNGEIILADGDALSETEVEQMAYSLLNEQQKKKFEQEWELCISLLHRAAGRVRATFYRRNGHPEMSCRFCGDRIPTRVELGLPEKIDE